MNFQSACELALHGVDYLTSHSVLLTRFLRDSGMDAGDLTEELSNPAILQAILAYMMLDDDTLTDFCQQYGFDYREVHAAVHIIENEGY